MTTASARSIAAHLGVLLTYGIASVLLRAPFWFTDRFNWDESTFIVVGASLLDGHLPYTVAWDNKPPFTYGWMAVFLAAFGNDIEAVRFGGALFVLGTAFVVYLIALRFLPRSYSILAGLVQIALASFYFSGQSIMSEHLAMFPLMAGIYLVMRSPLTLPIAATAGALLAAAVLARMNMAFLAVALGLLIPFAPGYAGLHERLRITLAYALGGLAVAAVVALVYLIGGQWYAFWFSVVEASLEYAGAQVGPLRTAVNLALVLLGPSGPAPFLRIAVVLLAVPGALLMLTAWGKRPELRYALIVFYVTLAVLGLSMLASGGGHGHYALQLLPFLSVFFAVTLASLAPQGRRRLAAFALTLLLIAIGMGPGLEKSRLLWQRHQAGLPLAHGPSFWAADVIRKQGLSEYSIYAMERNLLYWLLDKPIPLPLVTHPSNLVYAPLLSALHGPDATPAMVLEEILAQDPTFIIRREAYDYLAKYPDAASMLTAKLREYTEIGRQGDLAIYMRQDAHSAASRG